MQLEGMLLILLMLIIIPIFAISSNDTAFFIILSFIITLASIKSINDIFASSSEINNDNTPLLEEIEEQINIDIHKFEVGLKVIKNLIIILYFIYCSFYLETLYLKVIVTLVILYWSRNIISSLKNQDKSYELKTNKYLSLSANLSSLALITLTVYYKFF